MSTFRTADGKFISPRCVDPNCCGNLVRDTEAAWRGGPARTILRCDGLTHTDDSSPLIACRVRHETPNEGTPNAQP